MSIYDTISSNSNNFSILITNRHIILNFLLNGLLQKINKLLFILKHLVYCMNTVSKPTGKNTILSAYEIEGNMVTNLKQKNCIVVDTIRKLVTLRMLIGRIPK
jgi:hypothetical protein